MKDGTALTLALASVVALSSSSCDACAGVVGCSTSPQVGLIGQLRDYDTEAPVEGAIVDFIRTAGVPVADDSTRAVSDVNGVFGMSVAAYGRGATVFRVSVKPPNGPRYDVNDIVGSTSERRGDARMLPTWATRTNFAAYAELSLRGPQRVTLPNTVVQFVRTGGTQVDGPINPFSQATDANGLLPWFGSQVHPLGAGDLVGTLTVNLPAPLGQYVETNVHVVPSPLFRPGYHVIALRVGPSVEYHLEFNDRGRFGVHVAGVQVDFVRTGGVMTEPTSFTGISDASGRVAMAVRPLERGTLTGNITVTPPAPWKAFSKTGVQFDTFDKDGAVLHSVYGVGPGVPAYAILRANGVPVKGVTIDYRQVSGIAASPTTFSATTNDSGIVFLTPQPKSEGDIFADLTVHSPPPFVSFTVRGVRLPAIDGDVPGGRVLVGDWDMASPPTIRAGAIVR